MDFLNGKIRPLYFKYLTAAITFFSVLWTLLSLLVPNMFVKIFMTPTEEILKMAPGIIGCYGLSLVRHASDGIVCCRLCSIDDGPLYEKAARKGRLFS